MPVYKFFRRHTSNVSPIGKCFCRGTRIVLPVCLQIPRGTSNASLVGKFFRKPTGNIPPVGKLFCRGTSEMILVPLQKSLTPSQRRQCIYKIIWRFQVTLEITKILLFVNLSASYCQNQANVGTRRLPGNPNQFTSVVVFRYFATNLFSAFFKLSISIASKKLNLYRMYGKAAISRSFTAEAIQKFGMLRNWLTPKITIAKK